MLDSIEMMVTRLFGAAYGRDAETLEIRRKAAEIVERNFDAIVEEWAHSVEQVFDELHALHRPTLANALVRFLAHLRDPDDLRTYIHLRRHC